MFGLMTFKVSRLNDYHSPTSFKQVIMKFVLLDEDLM